VSRGYYAAMKSVGALWESYRAMRREQGSRARELTSLAVALAIGLTLVPLGIWAVGQLILGPYVREVVAPGTTPATGGFAAMWFDFLRGLGTGSPAHWFVLLSPYVIYLIARWTWGLRSRT
jgi:hypothetical protein